MQGRSLDSPLKTLTKKQESFAMEYVANGGNATQAYLATYEPSTKQVAWSHALDLTNHPLVAERIIWLKQQYLKSITIDPTTYVLSNLIEWNETTHADFAEITCMQDLKKLPKNKVKAISKIKITKNTDSEGYTKETVEIALVDKLQTIEKIAKHIDFYNSHQASKYKQGLTSSRTLKERGQGSSDAPINIQHNYYTMPLEELEKLNDKGEH